MVLALASAIGNNVSQLFHFSDAPLVGKLATTWKVGHSLIVATRLIRNGINEPKVTAASGLINYVAGDSAMIALAAQILQITRIRIDIANNRKELQEASSRLVASVDGSYQLPMKLLQDRRYIDPKRQPLLHKIPPPLALVALKSHYIANAVGDELVKAAKCAHSYLELAGSFYDIFCLQQAGGKLEIINNLAAVLKEVKESPDTILEEIESHQPLIDTILSLSGYAYKTKDLTDVMRKNKKTITKVQSVVGSLAGETQGIVQRAVFLLLDMFGLNIAPLGLPAKPEQSQPNSTSRKNHDHKGSTDKACASKHATSTRFYK